MSSTNLVGSLCTGSRHRIPEHMSALRLPTPVIIEEPLSYYCKLRRLDITAIQLSWSNRYGRVFGAALHKCCRPGGAGHNSDARLTQTRETRSPLQTRSLWRSTKQSKGNRNRNTFLSCENYWCPIINALTPIITHQRESML